MARKKMQALPEDFTCLRLQVHYIYTFMFQGFDWDELLRSADQFSESLELEQSLGKPVFTWQGGFDLGEPDPIDPFLALNRALLDIRGQIPADSIQFLDENRRKFPCNLKRHITLTESGVGTVDYYLTIPNISSNRKKDSESINKIEIIAIANLGLRHKRKDFVKSNKDVSPAMIVQDGKELFLFELFINDIHLLSNLIGKAFGQESWPWVEVDEHLVSTTSARGEGLEKHIDSHFQVPYPVIILELDKSVYAASFLDSQQAESLLTSSRVVTAWDADLFNNERDRVRESYHKDMLSILFRSKEYYYPDISFAEDYVAFNNGTLRNMCSVATGFLNLYIRSCLAVFPSIQFNTKGDKITSDPARYLIPALVQTVKGLRMRWHAYSVSARRIETVIADMYADQPDFKQISDKLVGVRRGIGWALRDPVSYSLSSGSLNTLYAAGLQAFRVDDLQTVITERISIIDRLYAYLSQKALARTDWIDDELARVRKKITELEDREDS